MRAKLTKRLLESLRPGPKRVRICDTELPGMAAVLHPSGAIYFAVRYSGGRRQVSLGRFGQLTVDEARQAARSILADVCRGADPLAERRAQQSAMSLRAWAETYCIEGAARKAAGSAANDRRQLDRLIGNVGGSRRLREITPSDIAKAVGHVREKHGPTSAAQFLIIVKSCLATAVRRDLLESNPASRLARLPMGEPRARVLSDAEYVRVVDAIAELPLAERALLTLAITVGLRRAEAVALAWRDVDFDGEVIVLPRTKAGRRQYVPLPSEAARLLRLLPKMSEWCFPGRSVDRHASVEHLQKIWIGVRSAAECPDVHLHDLRRTFGLHVARTAGIHVASKLLRHTSVKITEAHYAPLGLQDLREAMEKTEKQRAKILELRRPGAAAADSGTASE